MVVLYQLPYFGHVPDVQCSEVVNRTLIVLIGHNKVPVAYLYSPNAHNVPYAAYLATSVATGSQVLTQMTHWLRSGDLD